MHLSENISERPIRTNYLFKHWFAVITTAPLITVFSGLFTENNEFDPGEMLSWYLLLLLFGCFFSVPTLVLNFLVLYALKQTNISALITKILVTLLSVAGIHLTLFILGGSSTQHLALLYSIATVVTAFFIRINK